MDRFLLEIFPKNAGARVGDEVSDGIANRLVVKKIQNPKKNDLAVGLQFLGNILGRIDAALASRTRVVRVTLMSSAHLRNGRTRKKPRV